MSTPSLPRPHNARILCYVEPVSGIRETESGLAVVASANEEPLIGHVLGVGPDVRQGEFVIDGVKAHNRVMFSKYAGVTIQLTGKEYHVIEESDVLLVWPEVFPLPESLQAKPVETALEGPLSEEPLSLAGVGG